MQHGVAADAPSQLTRHYNRCLSLHTSIPQLGGKAFRKRRRRGGNHVGFGPDREGQYHSTWNLDHLKTTWGNTEGNPLWEEVRATVEMVGVHFC